MNILILNRDYPRFLDDMYGANPALCAASYTEQLRARNASLFGVADFYSHGFAAAGHTASEVHVNNRWLQSAWGRENDLHPPLPESAPRARQAADSPLSLAVGMVRRRLLPVARRFVPRQLDRQEERVLAAQIESLKPDVILNQEMSYIRSAKLERLVPAGTKIVGQIASALPIGEDFGCYHLIVSSLPNMVRHFEGLGLRAALSPLAFDARVLDRLELPLVRDIEVSFVGSLSADHGERLRLIETLARRLPLKVWGNGVGELPKSSAIRACFQGEAWGIEMYRVMSRSRVIINHHIDLAAGFSNNMRLYEATGCGSLMVVDRGRNLADLFEPEQEVVTYSSAQECVEAVERFLADESSRAVIAASGQSRTLSEHTYIRRTSELAEIFSTL